MSLAGFQSISKSISLEAPIKFKPTPPALELNRKTTTNRPLYANLIVCKRCNMFFKITTWFEEAVFSVNNLLTVQNKMENREGLISCWHITNPASMGG